MNPRHDLRFDDDSNGSFVLRSNESALSAQAARGTAALVNRSPIHIGTGGAAAAVPARQVAQSPRCESQRLPGERAVLALPDAPTVKHTRVRIVEE